MRHTLPLLLALAATPALAQETRQLDAHEHGVGTLDIAVEGADVSMAFHAPGADIVGFEYAATSDADVAAVEGALATLGRPLELFALPAAAGCEVMEVRAELEGGDAHGGEHDDHEGHDHGDEHDGHDDHADEGHDHAEKDHDEHAHDDHDGEGHDDHAAKASHTEFHAEYRLTCADPSAIDRLTFAYFDRFENAREVEVQVVTATGARAFEVTREAPALDLDGLF